MFNNSTKIVITDKHMDRLQIFMFAIVFSLGFTMQVILEITSLPFLLFLLVIDLILGFIWLSIVAINNTIVIDFNLKIITSSGGSFFKNSKVDFKDIKKMKRAYIKQGYLIIPVFNQKSIKIGIDPKRFPNGENGVKLLCESMGKDYNDLLSNAK